MGSPFNYDSFRDDISRIEEVLKEEYDDTLELPEKNDFSSYGDHGTDAESERNGACSSNSQTDKIHECLGYCFELKESITHVLWRLDAIEEDISLKQKSLEDKLAKCLKHEVEQKKKVKYYKPINLFATPYFRDVRKSIPSPNQDSIMKRLSNDVDAYTAPLRPWTTPEHQCLRQAVIENSRQKEIEPLTAKRDYYKDKLLNGVVTDEQVAEIEEKIENLEEAIAHVSNKTVEELLVPDKALDWMRISTLLHDGNRTADECERMWYNYMHPSINKKRWTQEEDDELQCVGSKHHFRDWERIASELKLSKRTAIQCLERYQSHVNPKMLKSVWTPEDDAELTSVVEACKIGDYIPWNQVSYHIHGRNRLQILNRWCRTLAPGLKKGPWSTEEDAVLLAAVDKYGYQWAKVEDLLPGRSSFACRERYTNVLVPDVVVGNWTKEEDLLLVKLMRQYPEVASSAANHSGDRKKNGFISGKWTKIASFLPGRTDNMCLQRASRIRKHHPELFENDASDFEDAVVGELSVPTHNCRILNSYREAIRATARSNMIKTMMKVKGYGTEEEAQAALDRRKTSRSFLFALSQQLLGDGDEHILLRKQPKKSKKQKLKFRKQKIKRAKLKPTKPKQGRKIKILDIESDTEDDDIISFCGDDDDDEWYQCEISSDRTHVKTEEELAVDAELDSLFMPVASCGFRPLRKSKFTYQSRRSDLEHKLLKSHLYKALHCENQEDSSDLDHVSTTLKGIDFAVSVPTVCRNVVFPSSDDIPVLPPNRQTLEAFKFLIINARHLYTTASATQCRDIGILSVITSDEKLSLFCSSCYERNNSDPAVSQQDSVNMPHLPTDHSEKDEPPESAKSGSACKVEPVDNEASTATCTDCQRLNAMRRDYHLLRKRFFSLFLWPALLTDIKPTEQQRQEIFGDARAQASNPDVAKKGGGTKRKTESETDKTDQTKNVDRSSLHRKAKSQPTHKRKRLRRRSSCRT